ncbi:MAG: 30S ribosomal protein S8 [Desulfomonile tiedjei]|uniref:Small ribosomal subunit protein uS8 n=1 Tax=Desulfomonile tiedjei TaxID=2358 RepID=A0A9D6V5F9_9BACT|nr:30S ribosomal protein S8 [Desulfomonile tiedjei]
MCMTDPIADMLTRIRNARQARKEQVTVPASNLKIGVAQILKEEGYVKKYKVIRSTKNKQGVLKLTLRFDDETQCVIEGLARVSRPGRRVYVGHDHSQKSHGGVGVLILSTSQGIMTDKEARRRRIGGEVLCSVW